MRHAAYYRSPLYDTTTFKVGANTLKTPILIVNASRDLETGYAWADSMQQHLG